MDLQEPVGINVPDSLRKAAWKLKAKSHAPFASEASDLVASVDSLTSTSRARVESLLSHPDDWTRILVYNRPGEGPNLGDPRLRDTVVVRKGTGTNAHNQPTPMVEYTYVSDQVPDEGIPWTGSVEPLLDKDSKKITLLAHPNYHGQLSRDDAIRLAGKQFACLNASDATVEVLKPGKSSKEDEKSEKRSPVPVLTPATQPVPG